jgi:hypothetical protein
LVCALRATPLQITTDAGKLENAIADNVQDTNNARIAQSTLGRVVQIRQNDFK